MYSQCLLCQCLSMYSSITTTAHLPCLLLHHSPLPFVSSITLYTMQMDDGDGVVQRGERRKRYGETVMQCEW